MHLFVLYPWCSQFVRKPVHFADWLGFIPLIPLRTWAWSLVHAERERAAQCWQKTVRDGIANVWRRLESRGGAQHAGDRWLDAGLSVSVMSLRGSWQGSSGPADGPSTRVCSGQRATSQQKDGGMDRWMDQANGTRERSFKRGGRWVEKDNKQNSQNIDLVLVLFYFQGARYLERWDGKNGILHLSPSPALTPSTQSTYLQNKTKQNKINKKNTNKWNAVISDEDSKTFMTFFIFFLSFAAFGRKSDSSLGQIHDQHRWLCGTQQHHLILGHKPSFHMNII